MSNSQTITAERNGVRRQFGKIQWNHLTSNGKKNNYDGWVQVDPDTPVAERKVNMPESIKEFKPKPVSEKEAQAREQLNASINGSKPTENFEPQMENNEQRVVDNNEQHDVDKLNSKKKQTTKS